MDITDEQIDAALAENVARGLLVVNEDGSYSMTDAGKDYVEKMGTVTKGQKILDGLKDAVAGNFSRVTIEGQTWVRYSDIPDDPMILSRHQHEALMALTTASQNAWELLRYQPRDLPCETETAAKLLKHALAALRAAGIHTEEKT